jgi:protein-S-isoprenylcysteine O-methyltransferase Ste14
MVPFIAIAGAAWAMFIIYWTINSFGKDKPEKAEVNWWPVGLFLIVVLIAFVVIQQIPYWLLIVRLAPDDYLVNGLGLGKLMIGLGFAVWARMHLADQWTAIPAINEEHRLIRTGPYKYVRHPIYAGVLAGLWGTAIIFGNLLVLVLPVLLTIGFFIKAHYEEEMLENEFGDEYLAYKQETRMLIPYVL